MKGVNVKKIALKRRNNVLWNRRLSLRYINQKKSTVACKFTNVCVIISTKINLYSVRNDNVIIGRPTIRA